MMGSIHPLYSLFPPLSSFFLDASDHPFQEGLVLKIVAISAVQVHTKGRRQKQWYFWVLKHNKTY